MAVCAILVVMALSVVLRAKHLVSRGAPRWRVMSLVLVSLVAGVAFSALMHRYRDARRARRAATAGLHRPDDSSASRLPAVDVHPDR